MLTHQEEYDAEVTRLRGLLAKRERLLAEIAATQRRVVAWSVLLNMPPDEQGIELMAGALKRGRVTEAIRQLLRDATAPLATKGLVAELRKLGIAMPGVNPEATINALANKLVTQGFASAVKRPDGKKGKAWVVRVRDKESS